MRFDASTRRIRNSLVGRVVTAAQHDPDGVVDFVLDEMNRAIAIGDVESLDVRAAKIEGVLDCAGGVAEWAKNRIAVQAFIAGVAVVVVVVARKETLVVERVGASVVAAGVEKRLTNQ